ncbi:MAG TPA: sigma factor-like helix-turn-helix DNA-binding protein, partial [Candidatus Polarisedimenticolia bacterium]|nr:sigma factor-like helix-turn-helix DNA-binding protein [Candidatus Polarisedimenticolia bacterium]
LPADAADNPEAQAMDRQLARRILDLSSKECREMFRLHFFEARSHQEISAILDVPVGTVKSRLFRCLEAVHQEISRGVLRNRARVKS